MYANEMHHNPRKKIIKRVYRRKKQKEREASTAWRVALFCVCMAPAYTLRGVRDIVRDVDSKRRAPPVLIESQSYKKA